MSEPTVHNLTPSGVDGPYRIHARSPEGGPLCRQNGQAGTRWKVSYKPVNCAKCQKKLAEGVTT